MDSGVVPKNKRRRGSERDEMGGEISSPTGEKGLSEIEREEYDGNGNEEENGYVRRFVKFLVSNMP